MNAKLREKANERLYVRLTKKEKDKIKKLAERAGISSVKELVLSSVYRFPANNFRYKKQFVSQLQKLTYEINQIGNNINQTVHAIHLMNISGAIREDLIKELIAVLKQYQAKRDELKLLFEKILYS